MAFSACPWIDMNPRNIPERIRTHARIWRLKASIQYDELRMWYYRKQLAYLRWKREVYERHELLDESREFQEEDDER